MRGGRAWLCIIAGADQARPAVPSTDRSNEWLDDHLVVSGCHGEIRGRVQGDVSLNGEALPVPVNALTLRDDNEERDAAATPLAAVGGQVDPC